MEIKTIIQSQYSNSKLNNINYSNSTVNAEDVLKNIADLIPNPDYMPWFAKQLKQLGTTRFMELANKARSGSETPSILFRWMCENNEIIR